MSEKLGHLDIVFAIDNTGSMGPYIEQVKMKVLEIIRTIRKEELVHYLRVGLVSYRDHPPQETSFVVKKFELTPDTDQIEASVRQMSAEGGGDGPEAVADALHMANRMEFKKESAKIVILIGDAPPHGVEPGNDGFPQGCPLGYSWEEEAKYAFDEGIVIHTVGCLPEIASYVNAIATFREIAAKTKGRYFALADSSDLISLITGIAIEEVDKIAIQQEILKELGVTAEELNPEDLTPEVMARVTTRLRGSGVRKRVVHEAPAPGDQVTMEEQAVELADVEEAMRQLKRKKFD